MRMQRSFLACMALIALTACSREDIEAAKYGHDSCRRVTLIDSVTGEGITGAEDFAVDTATNRLFFSAYDRRSVEKAIYRKEISIPEGGVYSTRLDSLFDPLISDAKAFPLVAASDIAGGLRPHGVSFDANNHELVFINRSYQRINNEWALTPRLQRIGANGETFVGASNAAPCSANDVLVTRQRMVVSFDHSACDWKASVEDIFSLKRSGIIGEGGGRLFDRVSFANGLTETISGEIVLAATREKALILLKDYGHTVEEVARLDIPGGPDNLSLSYDGGIIAAVHSSLWRLALDRKLGFGKSPSRVIKADPDTGLVKLMFDDPSGKLFSAATVAVEFAEGLVLGSVTDSGLLVCRAEL